MAELEIDPNKAFPIMFVCANDPDTLPPNSLANSTSLFAIPPRFMIIPDNIKNGPATNEKLSKLETIPCADVKTAISKGKANNTVAKDATAILITMRMQTTSNIVNKDTNTSLALLLML